MAQNDVLPAQTSTNNTNQHDTAPPTSFLYKTQPTTPLFTHCTTPRQYPYTDAPCFIPHDRRKPSLPGGSYERARKRARSQCPTEKQNLVGTAYTSIYTSCEITKFNVIAFFYVSVNDRIGSIEIIMRLVVNWKGESIGYCEFSWDGVRKKKE